MNEFLDMLARGRPRNHAEGDARLMAAENAAILQTFAPLKVKHPFLRPSGAPPAASVEGAATPTLECVDNAFCPPSEQGG